MAKKRKSQIGPISTMQLAAIVEDPLVDISRPHTVLARATTLQFDELIEVILRGEFIELRDNLADYREQYNVPEFSDWWQAASHVKEETRKFRRGRS